LLTRGLSVHEQGQGPPAIIQGPGWGPASDYLRVTLAPLLRGLRVITYDVRNTGRSERSRKPNSQAVEALVQDLEAVRRSRSLQRLLLLGHSHGAFVAMGYAVRFPRRVRAMVLIAPSLDEPPQALPAQRRFVQQSRAPEQLHNDRDLARWVRRQLPRSFHDVDAMRRFQAQLIDAPAPSIDALHGMPDQRPAWVVAGLSKLRIPSLVVGGRHDVITPPSEAERVQEHIPGARLVILERSGHNPWVEEPEKFTAAVQDFVSSI